MRAGGPDAPQKKNWETINSFQERGSPQQIKISACVLDNIEKVAMYSVTHPAREIGVSPPTRTRFSQAFEFTKNHEFQGAVQKRICHAQIAGVSGVRPAAVMTRHLSHYLRKVK